MKIGLKRKYFQTEKQRREPAEMFVFPTHLIVLYLFYSLQHVSVLSLAIFG